MGTINKDTKKFYSVASKPGNFGAAIYNQLFRLLGINAVYLPLGVARGDFKKVFEGLRYSGAQGINVSMPFKNEAKHVVRNMPEDYNINTLCRAGNRDDWYGYNTDKYGAIAALDAEIDLLLLESVFILGEGAVAHTIYKALSDFNRNLAITLGKSVSNEQSYDLFINATPIGMPGVSPIIPWECFTWLAPRFFDVVIPEPHMSTALIEAARDAGKIAISGDKMAMHGLTKQFAYHFPEHESVLHLVKGEMRILGYDV